MVLSPRFLSYARYALESLLRNALEPLHLHLITDSAADKELLADEVAAYLGGAQHQCTVLAKTDLNDAEQTQFARHPNLRLFRDGHPCWRKITDPLLASSGDDEIIVLDPDLYFPNKFAFEPTPDEGVLLMWQAPNCLSPTAMVNAALQKHITLAHHVDIGVAHWRAQPDLDWIEWLLVTLGIANDPNARFAMHIEAIVWAAIAMHQGGGYLPSQAWHCWRRSQSVRLFRKLGVPGHHLLRHQPFAKMKCLHAGGEAKHWLQGASQRGWLDARHKLDEPGTIRPFVELTSQAFRREQAIKSWLSKLGYYNVFPSGALQ